MLFLELYTFLDLPKIETDSPVGRILRKNSHSFNQEIPSDIFALLAKIKGQIDSNILLIEQDIISLQIQLEALAQSDELFAAAITHLIFCLQQQIYQRFASHIEKNQERMEHCLIQGLPIPQEEENSDLSALFIFQQLSRIKDHANLWTRFEPNYEDTDILSSLAIITGTNTFALLGKISKNNSCAYEYFKFFSEHLSKIEAEINTKAEKNEDYSLNISNKKFKIFSAKTEEIMGTYVATDGQSIVYASKPAPNFPFFIVFHRSLQAREVEDRGL